MTEFVISLPTWAGCALSMIATSVVGLVVYLVFYKLILKYKREDLEEKILQSLRFYGQFFAIVLSCLIIQTTLFADELRPNQEIENVISLVDRTNLYKTVVALQKMGNRSTLEKQWEAARWLAAKFQQIGLEVELQTYQWNGKIWPNVIAKKTGQRFPDKSILLLAHLDSITRNSDNIAPGADDNGSGMAVLLEAARLIKMLSVKHNVWFCIFSNEERGLEGSKGFVSQETENIDNFSAVVNLDVLGYSNRQGLWHMTAMNAHSRMKYKLKALYRIHKNLITGFFIKDVSLKVVGQKPNEKLVSVTADLIERYGDIKVKRVVDDNCG